MHALGLKIYSCKRGAREKMQVWVMIEGMLPWECCWFSVSWIMRKTLPDPESYLISKDQDGPPTPNYA